IRTVRNAPPAPRQSSTLTTKPTVKPVMNRELPPSLMLMCRALYQLPFLSPSSHSFREVLSGCSGSGNGFSPSTEPNAAATLTPSPGEAPAAAAHRGGALPALFPNPGLAAPRNPARVPGRAEDVVGPFLVVGPPRGVLPFFPAVSHEAADLAVHVPEVLVHHA